MLTKADNILAVAEFAARMGYLNTTEANITAAIEQLELAKKAITNDR